MFYFGVSQPFGGIFVHPQPKLAADRPSFIAHITHGIDGTKLGLSQELPVVVEVYFGPKLKLMEKIDLKFEESFTAELPEEST